MMIPQTHKLLLASSPWANDRIGCWFGKALIWSIMQKRCVKFNTYVLT
jgi:hypothetical protein